jgi:hypothetical protein
VRINSGRQGKMKRWVLLVPEKHVCTGFATAPSLNVRAVARSKSTCALGLARAVCAEARWSMPEEEL